MAGHSASNRLSLGGVPGNPGYQNRTAVEVSRERPPGLAAKPGNQGKGLSGLRGFAATAATTATGAYCDARCVANLWGGMAALNLPHAQKARAGARIE